MDNQYLVTYTNHNRTLAAYTFDNKYDALAYIARLGVKKAYCNCDLWTFIRGYDKYQVIPGWRDDFERVRSTDWFRLLVDQT